MQFPPPLDGTGHDSLHITEAYETMKEAHRRGANLLAMEAPDGVRLKIAADIIKARSFPLLDQLRRMVNVPRNWVEELTVCVGMLEAQLREAARELQDLGIRNDR